MRTTNLTWYSTSPELYKHQKGTTPSLGAGWPTGLTTPGYSVTVEVTTSGHAGVLGSNPPEGTWVPAERCPSLNRGMLICHHELVILCLPRTWGPILREE
jgi:hypothetical protein